MPLFVSDTSPKGFARIATRQLTLAALAALCLMLLAAPRAALAGVSIGGTPPATVMTNTGYWFQPWVTAAPGAKLTFAIDRMPAWGKFDTRTGILSGSVYAANVGTYTNILISVTDGSSTAYLPKFTVTVVQAGSSGAALQLSSATDSVSQSAGSVTIHVNRSGDTSQAVSVAYATTNGTAVAGTDYTAAQGTLKWSSGDATAKSFLVPISNRTPFTGSRTFNIAISNATGGAKINAPSSAAVTIDGSGSGGGGSSDFWVYHNGAFNWGGDLSYLGLQVNYKSTAGEPLDGSYDISCTGNHGGFQPYATNDDFNTTPYKYLRLALKPTIPNQKWVSGFYATGDVAKGVLINITDYGPAPVVGKWNTYTIPLGAGGYQLPAGLHIYKFMIQDQTANQSGYSGPTNVWYIDDIAFTASSSTTTQQAGTLQLSSSSYSVQQGAGSLPIAVRRTSGADGTVSVTYSTSNGSAVGGKNFTPTSGTLQWADGDTATKTISVPISDAAPFAGTAAFSVGLASAGGGAQIGTPGSANVTINGNGTTGGGGGSTGGTTSWVYHNGTFLWGGDLSYGGLQVNYSSTAGTPIDGSYDISCKGNNGGFQPYAPNDDFDTTPYKFLVISLKPTIANQTWISGFEAAGDVPKGVTLNITDFGPAPVPGQWNTYKIPLGAGGYQLPAGVHIYKFMIQDQTANQSGYKGPTNVWYADDIAFTSN